MSDIIVYTLPICQNCEDIKGKMRNKGIEFETRDLEEWDNYSDLLLAQVTFTEAPIVRIGNEYFDKQGAEERLKLN